MKFLVQITFDVPRDMTADERTRLLSAESARGLELMRAGNLVDIWRVPGKNANVSLYDAADATELHELLTSLPMWPWLQTDVQPLAVHPLSRLRETRLVSPTCERSAQRARSS